MIDVSNIRLCDMNDELHWETVYANTLRTNVRSQHVLQRVGFDKTGEDADYVYYRCDAANFANRQIGGRKMFVTSEALMKRIRDVSAEVFKDSNGAVSFEEYIALPYYGRICLRFNLNLPDFSVEDLDYYEQMIYRIVKDEFIIDFMGDVYRQVGVDYRQFDAILENLAVKFQSEVVADCGYAREIREDAKYLLNLCDMNESLEVWEIQPEEEILLLILGDDQKQLGTFYADGMVIHVIETNKRLCEGLTKAVEYAKRNGISLVRTFLENQSDPS